MGQVNNLESVLVDLNKLLSISCSMQQVHAADTLVGCDVPA